MKKIYLIPLALIVFFSCKNQPETEDTLITFENALEYDKNTISFESARFVKLENHEDAFIGENVKMKMVDDKIYLMDNRNQRSLLCFDNNGNFINKFGQRGNGPEEYLTMSDFCIKHDTVDLLVRNKDLFIYRYLSDGSFAGKFDPEQNVMAFEYDFNGDYLFYAGYLPNESFRIYISDKNGKILQSFLKNSFEITLGLAEEGNSFFKSEESILFRESFNDTIYSVSGNKLLPKYVMDFGSYSNSAIDKHDVINNVESMIELINRGMATIYKSYENKKYVLIHYNFHKTGGEEDKLHYLLYNKKNERTSSLCFNIDNIFISRNFLGLTEDNEIAFLVFPYGKELEVLKQLIPDVTIPELSEMDNAMLVFCKISSNN